jgi:hypothetical protein
MPSIARRRNIASIHRGGSWLPRAQHGMKSRSGRQMRANRVSLDATTLNSGASRAHSAWIGGHEMAS